ncbi:metalloregulator ArsR/SmtB family transcription factor [soil metagenome]
MSQETPSPETLDTVYAALSSVKRRGMVTTLSFRPATVGQLAEEHGLSLPAIHKHIRVLEEAGLTQRRKVGRTNYVAIARPALQQAQVWLSQFRTTWGSDSETLENYVANLIKSESTN